MVFSPQQSLVRRQNEGKVPQWLRLISGVESRWDALLQSLTGHFGPVSAVAMSADGQRIVSGSWDSTVRVWRVVTGDCETILEGHSGFVDSAAFSPLLRGGSEIGLPPKSPSDFAVPRK